MEQRVQVGQLSEIALAECSTVSGVLWRDVGGWLSPLIDAHFIPTTSKINNKCGSIKDQQILRLLEEALKKLSTWVFNFYFSLHVEARMFYLTKEAETKGRAVKKDEKGTDTAAPWADDSSVKQMVTVLIRLWNLWREHSGASQDTKAILSRRNPDWTMCWAVGQDRNNK